MYAKAAHAGGGEGGNGRPGPMRGRRIGRPMARPRTKDKEDVVEAEFEEVKE